ASPRGARAVVVWDRPLLDERTSTRASANAETAMLVARFVSGGHHVLAFARSRKTAELVAAQTRLRLDSAEAGERPPVAAYRAGYLPDERRRLEAAFSSGGLSAVIATNALELGIDIGTLDAVVLNGFPGTLASMRQQMGRAGRAGRPAAAILVA